MQNKKDSRISLVLRQKLEKLENQDLKLLKEIEVKIRQVTGKKLSTFYLATCVTGTAPTLEKT